MPTDGLDEDNKDKDDILQSNAFSLFVNGLKTRSDRFEEFLNEDEGDNKPISPRKSHVADVTKSVEDFKVKKLKLLKEIDDEEQADLRILGQLAADNLIRPLSVRAESGRLSALSLLTFTAEYDDPMQWNVEELGALTAEAEHSAMEELATLIEDQQQEDNKMSARFQEIDSARRPLSARLQSVTAENRLFYDRHSKPTSLLLDENMVVEEHDGSITPLDSTLTEIDSETNLLKKELELFAKQSAERKNKAATSIQASFRGYRVRKKYGSKLKKLISEAKKRLFEERVRQIEAERQRLTQLKRDEEMRLKVKQEEERKAAELEARKRQEEEERQRAEAERVRLAQEAEEQRKREELLAAEKAKREKEEQERLAAEVDRARLEKLRQDEEDRKKKDEELAEQLRIEKLRLEEELERKKTQEADEIRRKQEVEVRKSKESSANGKRADAADARHFPQPIASNAEERPASRHLRSSVDTTVNSDGKSMRASVERPSSRKEERRRKADEDYLMAKASFEENLRLSQQETPRSHKKPAPEAKKVDAEPVKSTSVISSSKTDGDVRRSVKRSRNSQRRPRFEVDAQKLKTTQMVWLKECRPWSETVAQLKVSTGRAIRQTSSSGNKNAVRPPPDCKPVQASDLLSRTFLRPLPASTSVTSLTLSNLQTQFDLSCLSNLVNLVCLDISYSSFTYLSNLDGCTRLNYLNASHNRIKDVDLNKLTEALSFLDISYNELTSLTGISFCTNLTLLNASYNRLVRLNLSLPANLYFTRLHSLDLSHNQLLSTREWLHSMPSLISLDVSSNNLRSADCLVGLGLLQFLNLSFNSLGELPDLSNCPLLVDADFSGNNLHAIDQLSKYFLPHLVRLNVSRNMLTSLPDVSNLFNLIEARLENNQIITYDALMKRSCITQLARLKFIRADFLCFSSDDAARLNEELRTRRRVELVSAEYDDAIALCCTLKLLISSGLLEDEEDGNAREDPDDDYLEYVRFVVLLQDSLQSELANLGDEKASEKRKATFPSLLDNRWQLLRVYFEESSKGANERRYGVEFCGIDTGKQQEAQKSLSSQPVANADRVQKTVTYQEAPVNAKPLSPRKQSATKQKEPPETTKKLDQQAKQALQKQKEAELEQKRRNTAAIRLQAGWRGFLARYEVARWHVAATIVQKTWRGHWVRKQIRAVLEQLIADDPSTSQAIAEDEFDNESNDKSVDDLLSFVSNIQSMSLTESINLPASRAGSRAGGPQRVAWTTPTPRDGANEQIQPRNRQSQGHHGFGDQNFDSPLPSSNVGSVPPVQLTGLETPHAFSSKKVQRIQEEWGFADPTTVELMLRRANRMKQADKKQKIAKLDANQRLALARKQAALESHRSPIATTQDRYSADTNREQYPTHEIRMGAGIITTGRPPSPSEVASIGAVSQRQNQTFAWVHSVIREPSPMPNIGSNIIGVTGGFPPITPGGFMVNHTGTGAVTSHRSSNSENRRRSGPGDNPTSFPPITPTSKPNSATGGQVLGHHGVGTTVPAPVVGSGPPKKKDLIRAWREPAVRLSGGWGGGRPGKKKK